MLQTVPGILSRIAEHKRAEIAARVWNREELEGKATRLAAQRRGFRKALLERTPAIIAESKKASPSKGLLHADYDPAAIAGRYTEGGAAAMSVLTDEKYFQGSLEDLKIARRHTPVPVLRKDFTIDELHVVEAAAAGADAILLIAAILTTEEMKRFRELAASFGVDSLVEVHDGEELMRALDSGAEILGVNNRDLRTFEVKLETSLDLAPRIPSNVVRVSESGIHSAADVKTLREAGYEAFLVGEHLMKAADPVEALRALTCS
ncbi:MAG: indole-3-glycerol phosphate synthase TrpC [Acidobacteriota bacterium]